MKRQTSPKMQDIGKMIIRFISKAFYTFLNNF